MTLPKGYERDVPIKKEKHPFFSFLDKRKKPPKDNVISSKGRQKRYYCDYCNKIFNKDDGAELKWRHLSSWIVFGWYHRHFICRDCKLKRLYRDDNGEYVD